MSNRALRTPPPAEVQLEKPVAKTLTMRERAFNRIKELIDRCTFECNDLEEKAKTSWSAWVKKHLWALLNAVAKGANWLLDKVFKFLDWMAQDVRILTRIKTAWLTFFGDINLAKSVEAQHAANAAMA